jgi:pSer/pThr/pTyr-binding forkhead associated (FHA) protein
LLCQHLGRIDCLLPSTEEAVHCARTQFAAPGLTRTQVSLGANGTYVDDEPISQVPVVDGVIIRLTASGPKIQICLEPGSSIEEIKKANIAEVSPNPTG